MPPHLALLLTFAFISWLLVRDMKKRQRLTHALWIPLLWLLVLGSKPVDTWFGFQTVLADSQLSGNPVDRLVYIFLIIAGLLVLMRRRVDWNSVIARNQWLFIFFLYLGASILWSDYPFIAFKRWITDVGNIIMVLVVLSESDPVEAARAVFLRCAFVLVPLSVTFIKYFPNLGRYYNLWTGEVAYGGVTDNKNTLGATLIFFGIILLWEMLELHDDPSRPRKRFEMSSCLLLLGMVAWLFQKADSQTSLVCALLGAGILLVMRLPSVRSQAGRVEFYIVALVLLFVLLNSLGITAAIVHALGRNMTLTGRTDIWQRALSVPINPLMGTGYYSFWLDPDRADQVSRGFFYRLNEAHSGYIETYLNEGLIGVCLLAALFIFALRKIKHALLNEEGGYPAVRLAFLLIAVVYDYTEAAFDRLDFIWVALLLAIIGYVSPPANSTESSRNQTLESDDADVDAPMSKTAEA